MWYSKLAYLFCLGLPSGLYLMCPVHGSVWILKKYKFRFIADGPLRYTTLPPHGQSLSTAGKQTNLSQAISSGIVRQLKLKPRFLMATIYDYSFPPPPGRFIYLFDI